MTQRDAAQVVTWAPDGSDPRYFGRIGHVTGLNYSFTCPGGPDQLSLTLQTPPGARDQALNPGRLVGVYRGGSKCWNGKLDEPTSGTGGWAVTAHGAGTFGADYRASYGSGPYQTAATSSSTETETQVLAHAASQGWTADGPVNAAIARNIPGLSWGGLSWVNPGIAASLAAAGASPAFLNSPTDPGSASITDFLTAITSPVGLLWYVGRWNVLNVFPPPTVPTRILICTSPAARTLHGYYTAIQAYYQLTPDSTTGGTNPVDIPATYQVVEEYNTPNAAVHGTMENFIDLTAVGAIDTASAQAVLVALLEKYQAASYSEAFPVQQGQLLTMGGTPVDLGCEQAGTCVQLVLADGGYGGEVSPGPVTFVTGAYNFSDDAQSATITPWQSALFDLPTMMGNLASLM